jgi:2-polyprenyl-3-methyl-5-hydroxy-6-metoxy-1,4-benzoquinol methylase
VNQDYGNLQKHLNPNPVQRYLLRRFHCQIALLVEAVGAERILDAGCGEGFVVSYLLQGNDGLTVTGIDSRLQAIEMARQMVQGVLFDVGDLREMPYSDDSFDLVMCLEVLEHLPDPNRGLRELRRVTSAHCLVSVPHEPFFRATNFLRGKHVFAWGRDPEHLQHWTARQFRRLVEQYFEIEQFVYSFPWLIALGRKE